MSSYGSFHDEGGKDNQKGDSNKLVEPNNAIKTDYQVGPSSSSSSSNNNLFQRDYATSNRIQILNGSLLVMMLLCWIACCVTFGGVLQTAQTTQALIHTKTIRWDFYWNRIAQSDSDGGSETIMYSDFDTTRCEGGGKGIIVAASLAFIALSTSSVLAIFRTLGKNGSIPFFQSRINYLAFEVALSSFTVIFFFLMTVIWGATCFTDSKKYFTDIDNGNDNLRATGFAYLCFCLFLTIFILILMSYLRNLELTSLSLISAHNDTLIPPHLSSSASSSSTSHAALSSSFSSTTPTAFPSAISDFPSAVSQDEL